MADVFHEMGADHARLQALLEELCGDPATPEPDPPEAKEVARALVMAASKHEALEEQLFWPALRDRAQGGPELALLGLEQEQTGKKLLNELSKTHAGTEEFRTLVLQVTSALRRHMLYEETQAWPRAMAALAPGEAAAMGERFAARRGLAPTRPHPLTPPGPRLQSVAGPVVGAVDHLRDALLRRG